MSESAGHRVAELRMRSGATRVYWPAGRDAALPLLIWFANEGAGAELVADCGVVVVSAGLPTFAAARGVLEWAAAHARSLGADGGSVLVAGEGGGAALAAQVVRYARDQGWPPVHEVGGGPRGVAAHLAETGQGDGVRANQEEEMSKVICGHAVSVDGYISGRTPDGVKEFGRGLGDAGMLFDWYFDGDTPSTVFDGFKLSKESAEFFDSLAARVGVSVSGRTTYEHSGHWGGGGPHPTAPLIVVSHRPAPEISAAQTLTTSIEDAIAAARKVAGDKDVAVMGGGLVTAALAAGLVDEVILHQVPVLLGGGHRLFQELPEHLDLRLVEAIPAPGVTHLHYEVVR